MEGGLGGAAVQVERTGGWEFAGAEAVPGGFVETGRVLAGDQVAGAADGVCGEWRWRWGFLYGRWFEVWREVWRGWGGDGAAGQRGDVADVIGPFGAVVIREGAWAPGHGGGLAGCT